MDNENKQVEEVDEPKIESRFGFQKSTKSLSQNTVKLLMIGAALSLGTIMWIRSPNKPENESSGVNTPETSEVGGSDGFNLENYSATTESSQMKEKARQKNRKVVLKLPGLQKIDRTSVDQIPPGSEVRARLLTGASNGIVRAEVLETLKLRGETFIRAGETLIGHGQSSDERLFIQFTQLVKRDGSVGTIQAQAVDNEDKTVGLRGSKFKRYTLRYGTAVGLNFVGGMTEGLQDRTIVGQNIVTKPNARNALLNGAGKAAIEMANDTMENLRNQPPPISVEAGREISVIFE